MQSLFSFLWGQAPNAPLKGLQMRKKYGTLPLE